MTISQPILNPKVPYVGEIEGGFAPGRMVRIQGRTLPNTQRFAVNLQLGDSIMPRADVALHMSVRVAESYVVFNTVENGTWGSEVAPRTRLPIGLGQCFEILILSDMNVYKVAVNGEHFGEFQHRLPLNLVSHIAVDGDVELSLVCFEGGAPEGPTEESRTPGLSFSGAQGSDDLDLKDLKDFQPSRGRQGGQFGPPQGQYGPQGNYGPQGPQGNYGPPGQYGPPQQYGPQGPYGQQGYGPPPPGYYPPGGEPPKSEGPGIFEGFLGQAGTAIASAIATNAINKIAGGGNQPPQQQQPNFFGGGGGVGSGYPGQQGSSGGPLSSLLGSLTGGSGGQGGQNPPQSNQGGGIGDFLSSAFSQFSNPQQRH